MNTVGQREMEIRKKAVSLRCDDGSGRAKAGVSSTRPRFISLFRVVLGGEVSRYGDRNSVVLG